MKETNEVTQNAFTFSKNEIVDQVITNLPYELTNAQKKVWQEIQADMQSERVMSRLIQGDVGSGKTIIAVLALMLAGLNGYQGALMAPTEVLAKQHYVSVTELMEEHQVPLKQFY